MTEEELQLKNEQDKKVAEEAKLKAENEAKVLKDAEDLKKIEEAKLKAEKDLKDEESKNIPYERFKEINDKNKELNNKLEEINKKLEGFDTSKIEEMESLTNKINELNNKNKEIIIESFKIEDKEMFDLVLNNELSKEENKDKDLTEVITEIQTKKPSLFKTTSSVGNFGFDNHNNNEMSNEEFEKMTKKEQIAIIKKGVIVL